MKKFPSKVSALWILGCLAVLHAALLLFSYFWFFTETYPERLAVIWFVFALLWFAWPLVLALHPAQSALRVLLPLTVAAPFVFLWFRFFSTLIGPQVLGLPFGVFASPRDLVEFGVSYGFGWLDAKKDARAGRIVLEGYGFGFSAPRAPHFSDETNKRCGIQYLAVSGCIVNARLIGHAYGRNDANMVQLRTRFPAEVKAAQDEEARWHQSYVDGENAGRAEAQSDLREGRLAIVADDPERRDDAQFEKWLRDKYGLGLKRVNPRADEKISNRVFGYASGYNRVADAEIERRFGKAADWEIWGEWVKIPEANPLPH